ncbi:MAG: N-acetyltransferase [Caulobacterales bacterium]|nr:N-acetyltransferase [Caulobacterales bacterium]
MRHVHDLQIAESGAGDLAAIERLYPDAFPGEDLLPLVRGLLADPSRPLSLVAKSDGELIGHGAFTTCRVDSAPQKVALLGPLAVAADAQGRGVGAALVRAGLERLKSAGFARVFVLGDPAYYERFGFKAETSVAPPYPLPSEWLGAWRSVRLQDTAPHPKGTLQVPEIWDRRSLWLP